MDSTPSSSTVNYPPTQLNHIGPSSTPIWSHGPLLYLPVTFSTGINHSGLIDTGSHVSLISSSLLEKLNISYQPHPIAVKLADKSDMILPGVCNLTFKIKNVDFTTTFHVTNSSTDDLLFGQNFLVYHRVSWHLSTPQFQDAYITINITPPFADTPLSIQSHVTPQHQPAVNAISLPPDARDFDTSNLSTSETLHFHQQLDNALATAEPQPIAPIPVPTASSIPPSAPKSYPIPPLLKPKLFEKLKSMQSKNQIATSTVTDYNTPLFLKTKSDGSLRLLLNFKHINDHLPNLAQNSISVHQQLLSIPDGALSSTCDLSDAYHTIPLHPDLQAITSFSTPMGKFQYLTLPQGLSLSPVLFQETLIQILQQFSSNLIIYMDDLIITTTNCSRLDHLTLVAAIFTQILKHHLNINCAKTVLLTSDFTFLGHQITNGKIYPLSSKLETIKNFPLPQSATEGRKFIGLTNFYQNQVPKLQQLLKPLHAAIHTEPFAVDQAVINAVEHTKAAFANVQGLHMLNPTQPILIMTDASFYAHGHVVFQIENYPSELPITTSNILKYKHQFRIIYFHSSLFGADEIIHHIHVKEAIGLNAGIQQTTKLIGPGNFHVFTDNAILKSHSSQSNKPQTFSSNKRYNNALVSIITSGATIHTIATKDNISDGLTRELADAPTPCDPQPASINHIQVTPEWFSTPNPLHLIDPSTSLEDSISILLKWFPSSTHSDLVKFFNDHSHYIHHLQSQLQDFDYHKLQLLDIHETLNSDLSNIQHKFQSNHHYLDFIIFNNTLYKNRHQPTIVLSNPYLIFFIIQEFHTHGHKGIQATIATLKQMTYIPKSQLFIHEIISACQSCQLFTHAKPLPTELIVTPTRVLFQCIIIDTVYMPVINNYKYLVIARDAASLWAESRAFQQLSAAGIVDFIYQDIIARFGLPAQLLSDNGSEFSNQMMTVFTTKYHIKHIKVAAYHPQSNGSSESSHKSLVNFLKKNSNWVTSLPTALFADRITTKSTGYSPMQLVLGFSPFTSIQDFQIFQQINTHQLSHDQLFELRVKQLQERELFLEHHIQSKVKEKLVRNNRINGKRSTTHFQLNDIVLVQDPIYHTRANKKAYPKFMGPYKIKTVLDFNVYQLAELSGTVLNKYFTADRLIPFSFITNDPPKETLFNGGNYKSYNDPNAFNHLFTNRYFNPFSAITTPTITSQTGEDSS